MQQGRKSEMLKGWPGQLQASPNWWGALLFNLLMDVTHGKDRCASNSLQ